MRSDSRASNDRCRPIRAAGLRHAAGSRHLLPALLALVIVLTPAAPTTAQVASPNARGISMGHLHYLVADVGAEQEFWVLLGGEKGELADSELVRMPGLMVQFSEAPAEPGPSIVEHVAFRVDSLAAIEARGFELERVEAYPGIASIRSPRGNRIELFEEGTATNVGFEPAYPDAVAERHNRPLSGALDSHHLHFYLAEDQVEAARDWYVEHFGAVPGMRWRYLAADLPGMNLNFSAATDPQADTRGRSLDHIGFEVLDLEAFCRALEAEGIVFEEPYRRLSSTLATAVLTDPWGTKIELSEGLAGR